MFFLEIDVLVVFLFKFRAKMKEKQQFSSLKLSGCVQKCHQDIADGQ